MKIPEFKNLKIPENFIEVQPLASKSFLQFEYIYPTENEVHMENNEKTITSEENKKND